MRGCLNLGLMDLDSTRRFSSRVENYVRYRPSYPPEIVGLLRHECGLLTGSVVADIGSGTGIFSELLLKDGLRVVGVEPNAEMRTAGERSLEAYPRFSSVEGTAEATSLPDASVDLITAAQAFHWFNLQPTRTEFLRILKPGGWIALIWNDRQIDTTPFLREYEALLQTFATDYAQVRHKELDLARVRAFIGSDAVTMTVLPNRQVFDFEGLLGRLLSSSYAPEMGHPQHEPMRKRLEEIFRGQADGGTVAFDYHTQVYLAQLSRPSPGGGH